MSFWEAIGGIVGGVDDVVSGLSSIFGADTETTPSYTVNGVVFTPYVNAAGATCIEALNTDDESDVVLNFARSTSSYDPNTGNYVLGTITSQSYLYNQGSTVGNWWADVTADIENMLGGYLSMCGVNASSTRDNSLVNAIAFSIGAIGVAAAINIIGGVVAQFKKTGDSWTFSITSTGPSLAGASVNLRAPDGTGAQMNMTFQPLPNGGEVAAINVPAGVNIIDTVAALDVTLQVDGASAESFFDEIRKKTRYLPKAAAATY
jgi:hypothetical protein